MDKLSNEQMLRLKDYHEKCIGFFTNTEPANRHYVNDLIDSVYLRSSLDRPLKVWLGSPLQAAVAAYIIKSGFCNNLLGPYGSSIWYVVKEQLISQLEPVVSSEIRFKNPVIDDLLDYFITKRSIYCRNRVISDDICVDRSFGDLKRFHGYSFVDVDALNSCTFEVVSAVIDQIFDNVNNMVFDHIKNHANSYFSVVVSKLIALDVCGGVYGFIYGQHSNVNVSTYAFIRSQLAPLLVGDKIDDLVEVSKNCGYWCPLEGIVIITEKQKHINLDSNNRLHSEDLPALEYADGFCVFAEHGIRKSDSIKTPKD